MKNIVLARIVVTAIVVFMVAIAGLSCGSCSVCYERGRPCEALVNGVRGYLLAIVRQEALRINGDVTGSINGLLS